MAEKPLVEKLLIKPGARMLLLNAPEGYLQQVGALPENTQIHMAAEGSYDWIQVFVSSKADIDQSAPAAIQALKPGGILWLTYPKKSGKIKTDINRDVGWETVTKAGWGGVTQISIDETWSALRFRPEKDVKRKADSIFRV